MVDWDEVFGYTTVKQVRVLDRRLGMLKYALMVGIFIYIVIFVIILDKSYLASEVPVGTIEVSLRAPDYIDPADHSYCSQYNGTEDLEIIDRHTCVVLNDLEVLFPPGARESMFITTRLKYNDQERVCGLAEACGRPYEDITEPTPLFVANPEDFTIRIRHSMQAVEFYKEDPGPMYSRNSADMDGTLIGVDGTELRVLTKDEAPIFTVQELLDASNTKLSKESDASGAEGTSMRDSGIIVVVFLEYSNRDTPEPVYTVRASRVAYSEYKLMQAERIQEGVMRVYNRHGIMFEFVQSGAITRFDFQTLLLSLVSSFALLAVSSTIVDIAMMYLAPEKAEYRRAKYEYTKDFSTYGDVQAQMKGSRGMEGIDDARLGKLADLAIGMSATQDEKVEDLRVCEVAAVVKAIHNRDSVEAEEEPQSTMGTEMKELGERQHDAIFKLLADNNVNNEVGVGFIFESMNEHDEVDQSIYLEQASIPTSGKLVRSQVSALLSVLADHEKVRKHSGSAFMAFFAAGTEMDDLYIKLQGMIRRGRAANPSPAKPTDSQPVKIYMNR